MSDAKILDVETAFRQHVPAAQLDAAIAVSRRGGVVQHGKFLSKLLQHSPAWVDELGRDLTALVYRHKDSQETQTGLSVAAAMYQTFGPKISNSRSELIKQADQAAAVVTQALTAARNRGARAMTTSLYASVTTAREYPLIGMITAADAQIPPNNPSRPLLTDYLRAVTRGQLLNIPTAAAPHTPDPMLQAFVIHNLGALAMVWNIHTTANPNALRI